MMRRAARAACAAFAFAICLFVAGPTCNENRTCCGFDLGFSHVVIGTSSSFKIGMSCSFVLLRRRDAGPETPAAAFHFDVLGALLRLVASLPREVPRVLESRDLRAGALAHRGGLGILERVHREAHRGHVVGVATV